MTQKPTILDARIDQVNRSALLFGAISIQMPVEEIRAYIAQNPTYVADCCADFTKTRNQGVLQVLILLQDAGVLDPETFKWVQLHRDIANIDNPRERRQMTRDLPTLSPSEGIQAIHDMRRSVESVMENKKEVQWIVEGMLPTGVIALLSASPKAGKTTLLLSLLAHMDMGTPWAGMPVERQPAWLFTEEGDATLKQGMEKVGMLRLSRHSIIPVSQKNMDWPTFCDHVASAVARMHDEWAIGALEDERPPWLLIFDTLGSWTGSDDMNDYSEMTNTFAPLKKLRDSTGCCILVIHHNRKQSGDSIAAALGSTAITAHADIIMGLTVGEGNARNITSTGRFSECIPEFTVILDEESQTYKRGLDKATTDSNADRAMLLGMFQPDEELSMSALMDRRNGNGWGKMRMRKTIKSLLGSGDLITNGLGPNSSKLAYRVGEITKVSMLPI